MFYVPRDRELTVKLWRAIALRYSGDPAILGYDILNEPIAPYHDTATLNMRLEPFYRQVTQAIREVDPGRIVILAGGQWSSSFDMFGPPFADNLAYTYHSFWASTKRDSIQRHLNFANRLRRAAVPGRDRRAHRCVERSASASCRRRTASAGRSGPTRTSTRPRPWCRSRGPTAGTRSWPSPTASERTSPTAAVIDRAIAQYLDGITLQERLIRWSYLASLGLKSAPYPHLLRGTH